MRRRHTHQLARGLPVIASEEPDLENDGGFEAELLMTHSPSILLRCQGVQGLGDSVHISSAQFAHRDVWMHSMLLH